MNRATLVSALAVLLMGLPEAARAAEPAAGSAVNPFAPPAARDEPVNRRPGGRRARDAGSDQPEHAEPTAAPSPSPATPARRPVSTVRARKAPQASDEASGVARKGADQSGFAIELSTSGFASGALVGGLFLGGRTQSGLILGGFLNYGMTSLNVAAPGGATLTTSTQFLRIGAGLRHSFVQSADRLVDLYGAGDVSFDYQSVEVPSTGGTMPTQTTSAAGFSLALGPGLRLWVHDQIAVGYVARLRVTYLSGGAGALSTTPNDNPIDASMHADRFRRHVPDPGRLLTSGQARQRRLDLRQVAPAEQVHVHHQRVELVQRRRARGSRRPAGTPPRTPRTRAGRSRRTASSSRDRSRGGRRTRPDRSGTARRGRRRSCCRPTDRRAGARAARAARTASRAARTGVRSRAGCAAGASPASAAALQLRAEAPHAIELRPGDGEACSSAAAGRRSCRDPARTPCAPCRCSAASPRPSRSSKSRRAAPRTGSAPAPGTASARRPPTPPARRGRAAPSPRPARRARAPRPTNMSLGALTLHLHEHPPPVGQRRPRTPG